MTKTKVKIDEVQSVLFDKAKFTDTQAVAWLKEHGYKGLTVDEKPEKLHYRQHEPSIYERFRTISIGDGIQLTLGFKGAPAKEVKKAKPVKKDKPTKKKPAKKVSPPKKAKSKPTPKKVAKKAPKKAKKVKANPVGRPSKYDAPLDKLFTVKLTAGELKKVHAMSEKYAGGASEAFRRFFGLTV